LAALSDPVPDEQSPELPTTRIHLVTFCEQTTSKHKRNWSLSIAAR